MKSYIHLIFIVLFLIVSSNFLFAGDEDSKVFNNFTLNDYDGKTHSLKDYKDSKAIVIMFIATRCPVSNDYNDRMAKVYADYKNKDVTFLGINSNKQEDSEEIKEHAAENGLNFIILKDQNNKIADVFDASFTPEIFVLSPKYELLYHGRIDDSRKQSKVNKHDLRNTLDETLAGKEVSVKVTKAFGCSIKRVKND
jgi:peroxiredoxin